MAGVPGTPGGPGAAGEWDAARWTRGPSANGPGTVPSKAGDVTPVVDEDAPEAEKITDPEIEFASERAAEAMMEKKVRK